MWAFPEDSYLNDPKNGPGLAISSGTNIIFATCEKEQDYLFSNENDLDINSPNFWEGTRLLRYLLQNYLKYANNLLMIVSSLSLVNKYVVNELLNVKFQILENHTIPIKVYNNGKNILDNKKIMKLLTSYKKQITINNNTFNVGIVNNNDDINNDWKYNHTIYFIYLYM